MSEITLEDAESVGGGAFSVFNFFLGHLLDASLGFAYGAVKSGQVDYAGLAESQGTYYNTVGA